MAPRRKKNEDDEEERHDPFADGSNDAAERLADGIERFETLQVEIEERQGDQREIMRELGSQGYEVKQIRRVIAVRKQMRASPDKWQTSEAVFHTYLRALGIETDGY